MDDYRPGLASFLTPLKFNPTGTYREGRPEYVLLEGFLFVDGDVEVPVPAGFITDLASVPYILRWILPPDGRYAKAAVVHDFMYENAPQFGWARRTADRTFLHAMQVLSVGFITRQIMYWSVRLFGWWGFERKTVDKVNHDRGGSNDNAAHPEVA